MEWLVLSEFHSISLTTFYKSTKASRLNYCSWCRPKPEVSSSTSTSLEWGCSCCLTIWKLCGRSGYCSPAKFDICCLSVPQRNERGPCLWHSFQIFPDSIHGSALLQKHHRKPFECIKTQPVLWLNVYRLSTRKNQWKQAGGISSPSPVPQTHGGGAHGQDR